VVLDLIGEVGDQLGSLCKVGLPDRMGVERFWNAGKPGHRRQLWEAPVEDHGHVSVANAGEASLGRYSP
jgi:hypothetical protein